MSLITEALNKLDNRKLSGATDLDTQSNSLPASVVAPRKSKRNIAKLAWYMPGVLVVVIGLTLVALPRVAQIATVDVAKAPVVVANSSAAGIEIATDGLAEAPAEKEPTREVIAQSESAGILSVSTEEVHDALDSPGNEDVDSPISSEEAASIQSSETELVEEAEADKESIVPDQMEISITQPGRGEFEAVFEKARNYQNIGDHFNALRAYQESLNINPDASQAYVNMARIYASVGDLDMAISRLEMALSINPQSEAAHNNLGVIHLRRGDDEAALREFTVALTIRPSHPDGHINSGVACMRLGRPRAAAEAFERALRLSPEHPDAHYNLALLLDRQGAEEQASFHYSQFLHHADDASPGLIQRVQDRNTILKEHLAIAK